MQDRKNKDNQSVAEESSDQETQQEEKQKTQKVPDFYLTTNQLIMITNKLPKGFSLQLTKNIHRSRKLLSEIVQKPINKKEKIDEKEQFLKLGRDSSKMTIKSNDSQESIKELQHKTDWCLDQRKSERIFLREKVVYYDLQKQSQHDEPKMLTTQSNNNNSAVPDSFRQETILNSSQSQNQLRQNTTPQKKVQQSSVSRQHQKNYEQKYEKQWLILRSLQGHSLIDPFTSPVDEERDCAPRYYQIVQKPMDLATIQNKLEQHLYKDHSEFDEDVKQIWKNSYIYNKTGSAMARITAILEKYYQNLKQGKKLKNYTAQIKKRKR